LVNYCDCSPSDFVCDEGFERTNGEYCVPIKGNENSLNPINNVPEVCNETYLVSKGYKAIPGNMCINGYQFEPFTARCPFSFYYLFKLILKILGVMLILGILYKMVTEIHWRKYYNYIFSIKKDTTTSSKGVENEEEESSLFSKEEHIKLK